MEIKATKIYRKIRQDGFTEFKLADVKEALQTVPVQDIIQKAQAEYSWTVWDKISPINGVDAETVLKSHKVSPDDVVLLFTRNGRVEIFQPIMGGKTMSEEQLKQIAEEIISTIVKPHAEMLVYEEVIDWLLENKG
jgi:carbon monoxide dehydrogenase subunit G